ncbi:DUF262 domain-containing protein [Paracoccus xiamenensis]|uniref:DUF262 domain-containing protein n=1 Tax=Paracoccus xiamenensis TaxID=2714901 RepID=UPI001F28B3F2|nr:DUF262 domain-containing protein [Paracoccus xiamenensis]
MLERRELVVNQDYQRGSGIWPTGPSSYFVDTIIENFPFPKIYMYEFVNREDRKVRKEIVDGQQRISAITRFYQNEFALGSDSKYAGCRFQDLNDEAQEKFLTYVVSVDVIRSAQRGEILQMFRRMNAYTLPLNEAEKRHSSFQGEFKWFVNEFADNLNEFFLEFGVFTNRQIVRMSDAAMISECVDAYENGVISSSPKNLRQLYLRYDEHFDRRMQYHEMLSETFQFIVENLVKLRTTFMMKPYALHSLITALLHCRFGIQAIQDEWGVQPLGEFSVDPRNAELKLLELAQAHEAKEDDGPHAKYVWGCLSTTDRKSRRTARVAAILRILGADVPEAVDADLA